MGDAAAHSAPASARHAHRRVHSDRLGLRRRAYIGHRLGRVREPGSERERQRQRDPAARVGPAVPRALLRRTAGVHRGPAGRPRGDVRARGPAPPPAATGAPARTLTGVLSLPASITSLLNKPESVAIANGTLFMRVKVVDQLARTLIPECWSSSPSVRWPANAVRDELSRLLDSLTASAHFATREQSGSTSNA